MKKIHIYLLLIVVSFQFVLADKIGGSKHDLSINNPYGFFAGASTEICIFCHTPHASNTDIKKPIWNRKITDTSAFTLYSGIAGTPNNASMVCLSCHDGVSGLGDESAVAPFDTHNVINNPGAGHEGKTATPNCYACHFSGEMYPQVNWRIGPNLTDDHPVSVNYAVAVSMNAGLFRDSPINGVKLFDGFVECASCHSVHDPANTPFLRTPNSTAGNGSGLCKSCHLK